jgi:hypothetical protein
VIRYALYPAAEAGLPHLAVILNGNRPVEMFGCHDLIDAHRVLNEMKARMEAKLGLGRPGARSFRVGSTAQA